MRRFLIAALVVAVAALAPVAGSAQSVLKVVMHSDVKALDPIWSGAYITRNHGYMLFDTLFSMDGAFQIKPQMVDSWKTSDDGLLWTFTLRDGLEWHDGTAVTAEDCVASLKRWSARDGMGQKLALAIAEYKIVDPRTFQIVLKQKFGPMLEALGKPSVVVPFMMPRKAAETDAFAQSDNVIGSGPFIFRKEEWKPGEKIVYVKNPRYKPRPEPMSGMAGGKVAKVDRVEWLWIPDAETQINALLAGEIDMIENISPDYLPVLEKNKDIRLGISKATNQYVFRMNWLQPPFDNQKIRQAAAYALSQEEFLQAGVGDKRYWQVCKAMFTCGTPLASTAGMDGLIDGNAAKARALLAEANYDGTVVVMPQPTDLGAIKQIAPVAKAQLEKAGFKVEIQAMDWQTMGARLSKKGPVSEGGWNAFGTNWFQLDVLDPLVTAFLISTCDKARAGWPCDSQLEKLRDAFVNAGTPAERKAAADAVQTRAMQVVTHVPLGEWHSVMAIRNTVQMPDPTAPVTVFWGISKK